MLKLWNAIDEQVKKTSQNVQHKTPNATNVNVWGTSGDSVKAQQKSKRKIKIDKHQMMTSKILKTKYLMSIFSHAN